MTTYEALLWTAMLHERHERLDDAIGCLQTAKEHTSVSGELAQLEVWIDRLRKKRGHAKE